MLPELGQKVQSLENELAGKAADLDRAVTPISASFQIQNSAHPPCRGRCTPMCVVCTGYRLNFAMNSKHSHPSCGSFLSKRTWSISRLYSAQIGLLEAAEQTVNIIAWRNAGSEKQGDVWGVEDPDLQLGR